MHMNRGCGACLKQSIIPFNVGPLGAHISNGCKVKLVQTFIFYGIRVSTKQEEAGVDGGRDLSLCPQWAFSRLQLGARRNNQQILGPDEENKLKIATCN